MNYVFFVKISALFLDEYVYFMRPFKTYKKSSLNFSHKYKYFDSVSMQNEMFSCTTGNYTVVKTISNRNVHSQMQSKTNITDKLC